MRLIVLAMFVLGLLACDKGPTGDFEIIVSGLVDRKADSEPSTKTIIYYVDGSYDGMDRIQERWDFYESGPSDPEGLQGVMYSRQGDEWKDPEEFKWSLNTHDKTFWYHPVANQSIVNISLYEKVCFDYELTDNILLLRREREYVFQNYNVRELIEIRHILD